MTVIFSNFNDFDTLSLRRIWRGFDCNVIEITRDTENYEELVDAALEQEDDILIMCGHGTTHGLLHLNLDSGQYIIHENNAHLIHATHVIGCWCWAAEFADQNHLHGFFTGMFISNLQEAEQYNVHTDEFSIQRFVSFFTMRMNHTLHRVHDTSFSWLNESFAPTTPLLNDLERFNIKGFRYFV